MEVLLAESDASLLHVKEKAVRLYLIGSCSDEFFPDTQNLPFIQTLKERGRDMERCMLTHIHVKRKVINLVVGPAVSRSQNIEELFSVSVTCIRHVKVISMLYYIQTRTEPGIEMIYI